MCMHAHTHRYTHNAVAHSHIHAQNTRRTQGLTYSLSALNLALSELPRVLLLAKPAASQQDAAEASGRGVLSEAVHGAVRLLAVEVGDAEQVRHASGAGRIAGCERQWWVGLS